MRSAWSASLLYEPSWNLARLVGQSGGIAHGNIPLGLS